MQAALEQTKYYQYMQYPFGRLAAEEGCCDPLECRHETSVSFTRNGRFKMYVARLSLP